LKHHSTVSQYGQLSGSLALNGNDARQHFKKILNDQVCPTCRYFINMPDSLLQILSGAFTKHLSSIEAELELDGSANPLNALYEQAEQSELAQAEKRVRHRLADLLAASNAA
jgi:hypothetical protein